MNMQIVDIPQGKKVMWGRFTEILARIEALPKGKCIRLERMKFRDVEGMRATAKGRGYKLHFRTKDKTTFVWKGEDTQ